jgi:hypothetical protein
MRIKSPVIPCVIALAIAGPVAAQQARIGVANEGGIRKEWMLADGVTLVAPQYPQGFVSRRDTVCVGVGYLIQADGTTSEFTLLKGWNSALDSADEPVDGYWSAFAEAAADALKQWRFKPRPEIRTPIPVYTVATFVFGSGPAAPTEMRARCAIPDLTAHLQALRSRTAGGGILDRLELGVRPEESDIGPAHAVSNPRR